MARGTRSTPTPADANEANKPGTETERENTAQGGNAAGDADKKPEGDGEGDTEKKPEHENTDDTLNRPLNTNFENTEARAGEATGAGPDTQHGADIGPAAADTEVARVDQVDITRPNQGLVDPSDHSEYAPPFLSIANRPAGSQPTNIDLATGLPAKAQIADEDKERLAELKREAEA